MAVDSRDKRSSAINVGSPWRGMLPTPGAFTPLDKQHVAFMYRGITATGGSGDGASERRYEGRMLTMGRWMNR